MFETRHGRGRPPKEERGQEPRASLVWRSSRAYGEFRAWSAWGGRREPLIADGEKFATTEPNTAAILFINRLQELRGLRRSHPNGIEGEDLNLISAYINYHIGALRRDEGGRKSRARYIENVRFRLNQAATFFASRGVTRLRQISPDEIEAYIRHLQTFVPSSRSVKGRQLSSTTQRQYIDALGHMLQRAFSHGRVVRNWVRGRIDLPSPGPSPSELLELGECALLLETARRLFPLEEGHPIYPLLAFLLFTGCIESERAGVELRDIHLPGNPDFICGVVFIRPNASRPHLKTIHRDRLIPMQPQLGEILEEYLNGPCAPPGPLVFSKRSADGTTPIGDWRKSLDRVAKVAGFRRGEVRTRRFRVAFATHRLCTLDEHGQPMTAWKLRGEMGHSSEQMIERRYGRYAKHRAHRPVLEYRWEHWREHFGYRLITGLARLLTADEHRALTALAEYETTRLNGLRLEDPRAVYFCHWKRLMQFGLATIVETDGVERQVVTPDGYAVLKLLAHDHK